MYPPAVTLPDELCEVYLSLSLHLLDEFEQPSVIGLVASDEVCSAAQHMMAVLRPTHKRVELLAAIA